MKSLARRKLLQHLVLAALLGALPASLRRAGAGARAEALAARLTGCLSDAGGAYRLGAAYLVVAPEEADRARLALHIAGGAARARALARRDTPDLRRWLRGRQRRDFAAGRTVEVAGWVLSRTEARLCALVALARRQAAGG
jgi:hypothetical protein